MNQKFTFITTKKQLGQEVLKMNKEPVLGIDIECENNLHHYGSYISIIQISSKKENWIIDLIELNKKEEIKSLIEIFHNKDIIKIFHDISFDLRILNTQFEIKPKNIFDTQLAAQFLGITKIGLGNLLEEYYSVKKEKKYQMVDWTKRPLTKGMLDYAIKDTLYLIKLKNLFVEELAKKKRLKWVQEELEHISTLNLEYHNTTFSNVKGFSKFTDKQRAIFKRLFKLREKLAKKNDRPEHHIISTRKLIQYSLHNPAWDKIRGVHPVVRKMSHLFDEEFNKGSSEKIILQKRETKRFSLEQKEQIKILEDKRIAWSEKEKLPKHLVLNQKQIKEIIIDKNNDCLRTWQKNALLIN